MPIFFVIWTSKKKITQSKSITNKHEIVDGGLIYSRIEFGWDRRTKNAILDTVYKCNRLHFEQLLWYIDLFNFKHALYVNEFW